MSAKPKRDGIFGDRYALELSEDHQPPVRPRAGEELLPRLDEEEDEADFDDEQDKIGS